MRNAGVMRYADGGGQTAERRAAREGIRLEAGQRFARGDRTSDIAKDSPVSERSVEQWRRAWREGGVEGLKSKGPAKLPKLSDERFPLLEAELAKGPATHGWEDQRWTLERVRTLIGRQFGASCSIAGVWRLLHRHGWSWQSPARRALERDEHAVEPWKNRGHALELAHTLGIASARALDLDRALGLVRVFIRAHNRRGSDLDFDRGLDLDLDHSCEVIIEVRTSEVCRAIGLALRRDPPVLDTDSMHTLLDDDGDS